MVRIKIKIVLIIASMFYFGCANKNIVSSHNHVQMVRFKNMPIIGRTQSGQDIHLGGLSSLVLLPSASTSSVLQFVSLTDRGPNGAAIKRTNKKPKTVRPFLLPKFAPSLIYFEYDQLQSSVQVTKTLRLLDPNGQLLTGLPPVSQNKNVKLEGAVDEQGHDLLGDLLGIDPEGLAIESDGHIWVSEEYRPGLIKFSSDGKMLAMYVPKGFYLKSELHQIEKQYGRSDFIQQILPEKLLNRKLNRGFEGVAFAGDNIILMLQSPMKNDVAGDKAVRFIILNERNKISYEVIYNLESVHADKLGDLAVSGEHILVLEQDSKVGEDSVHKIFEVNLVNQNKEWELVGKVLRSDLVQLGIHAFEKLEGVAISSKNEVFIVNDNDFGLKEVVGKVRVDESRGTYLIRYKLSQ